MAGNEDAFRESIDALTRGELDEWLSIFDPEIVWIPIREWPDPSTRHGIDELREFIEGVFADWEVWEMTISEIRERGDRLMAGYRVRSVGRQSGIELKGQLFQVCNFRDGKIVRTQDFMKREMAEAAFAGD
jgi:ketosteroid isomerase-like protein